MPQSERDGQKALDLLTNLLARAKRAGADAADALYVESASLSHAQRLGNVEKLERAESRDLGLRVLIGRRQAIVSSTDQDEKALAELVERAIAMARAVPEDPFCGLAPEERILRDIPVLDICDAAEPAPETLIERASACEEAARAVKGITNSEGAEAGWSLGRVTLAATNGFAGSYRRSHHSVGVAVLAGEGTAMERDYDFATAVNGADLEAPEEVGRRAGEKAVKRLNPKKLKTTKAPVVYDPRVSNGLVSHLGSAINGSAIARGTSFLKDRLNTRVLPPGSRVTDDPLRARGLRSRPFDGEGIAAERRRLVEDGVLLSWLLDLRTARRLGLETTGHARARHLGPARARPHQPLSRARRAFARRAHQGDRAGSLRHRAHRLRRQRRHRRLQPGCRRLLDRGGRARLSGERDHHRGQPQGHVPGTSRRPTTSSSATAPTRPRCASPR